MGTESKNIDNLYVKTENNHLSISYVQMKWQPKEDITSYELALCIPYLNRLVHSFEVDESLPHFRHFEIYKPI